MRKSFFALTFFLSINVYAQTYFFSIKQDSIKNYILQEQSLGSFEHRYKANFINTSSFNLGQPFMFRRTNVAINPAPVVQYFFSIPDSIVREIHIEIDSTNYSSNYSNYIEPSERLKEFNSQYELIKEELISIFGEPYETNKLQLKKEMQGNAYWKRKDNWENDTASVVMYLSFSDEEKVSGQYRVRAIVYFKDRNIGISELIDDLEIDLMEDRYAKSYTQLLIKKEYAKSWEMLAVELKTQITFENYVKVAIDFNEMLKNKTDEIELYMSGATTDMTGRSFHYYSYKFKSDTNVPPKLAINVTFSDNEKYKIIGFQPKVLIGEIK